MRHRHIFALLCMTVLIIAGCSKTEADPPTTVATAATEAPVSLTLDWHGHTIYPGQIFGNLRNTGAEIISVHNSIAPDDIIAVTEVASDFPEYLTAEVIGGAIHLSRIKSFEEKAVGFTITYNGKDYRFYIHDDTWDTKKNGEIMQEQPISNPKDELVQEKPISKQKEEPQDPRVENFLAQKYTSLGIADLIEQDLTLEEACEKISTVGDAIEYLYQRGYRFEPDNHGITAEIRFDRNAGACVGNSALFNALLDGDYEQMGYVYIFYARTEHVFNYYVLDGEYYFCDFTKIFHDSGRHPEVSPIHLICRFDPLSRFCTPKATF